MHCHAVTHWSSKHRLILYFSSAYTQWLYISSPIFHSLWLFLMIVAAAMLPLKAEDLSFDWAPFQPTTEFENNFYEEYSNSGIFTRNSWKFWSKLLRDKSFLTFSQVSITRVVAVTLVDEDWY